MFVYTLRTPDAGIATTTAKTLLQLQAPAAGALRILRASISQYGSLTSQMAYAGLVRKTAAATVTAAVAATTLNKNNSTNPTAGAQLGVSATGHTATVEGTDGERFDFPAFNTLNGWNQIFIPEEVITVPGGGLIALKSWATVTSVDWHAEIVFQELRG